MVVKKEMGTKRVEKELPVMKEDLTPHANRVGKAKQKMIEATLKLKSQPEGDTKDVSSVEQEDQKAVLSGEDEPSLPQENDDELLTDNDGWVYGDNKWKATSSSGGLGKVRIHFKVLLFLPHQFCSTHVSGNGQESQFSLK